MSPTGTTGIPPRTRMWGAAWTCASATTGLKIWADGTRVSSHPLLPAYVRNRYSTNANDLPEKAKWRQWDRTGAANWANRIGPSCSSVIERIFESVRFDEQGLGAALAVLRLAKPYSNQRLEAACRIALQSTHSPRYRQLKPILANQLDQAGDDAGTEEAGTSTGFVRGGDYYGKAVNR